MHRRRKPRRGALVVAALAAAMLASTYAAAAQRGGEPPRRSRGVRLTVGQAAPDFELLPLEFGPNEDGEMVARIGASAVKLSAFRGKAPVVIFSSSYT